MKIFITGGSGFVGRHLTRELSARHHQVTILTRRPESGRGLPFGVDYCIGDPNLPGPWQESLSRHELVINLAGASIFSRWTDSKKAEIRDSRIRTTRHLVDGIEMATAANHKIALLSTSAVGYYGNRGDAKVEENDPAGVDFLAQVASAWEREALRAENFGARVVLCRFGIVLGPDGGALSKMLPLFRWGLGSHVASGRQWFPWIHQSELSRIFTFLVEQTNLSGVFNCVTPEPVTNAEFSRQLAAALQRWTLPLGVPELFLKLTLGEMASVLLGGQRVSPTRLLAAGYKFSFPNLKEALADLLRDQSFR
ncbi:MAG TPA: TIGR01777 family protein [Proteobacteria bacterium]|nr:TIGR01777 family protein [Pseudomonadota bacterium]